MAERMSKLGADVAVLPPEESAALRALRTRSGWPARRRHQGQLTFEPPVVPSEVTVNRRCWRQDLLGLGDERLHRLRTAPACGVAVSNASNSTRLSSHRTNDGWGCRSRSGLGAPGDHELVAFDPWLCPHRLRPQCEGVQLREPTPVTPGSTASRWAGPLPSIDPFQQRGPVVAPVKRTSGFDLAGLGAVDGAATTPDQTGEPFLGPSG